MPAGASSGDDSALFPPDLAAVVAAWPGLPPAARQSILGIVRQAAGGAQP